MKKTEMEKIVSEIKETDYLKTDDYFKSSVFYYLAGGYPKMTIASCTRIVDELRKEYL